MAPAGGPWTPARERGGIYSTRGGGGGARLCAPLEKKFCYMLGIFITFLYVGGPFCYVFLFVGAARALTPVQMFVGGGGGVGKPKKDPCEFLDTRLGPYIKKKVAKRPPNSNKNWDFPEWGGGAIAYSCPPPCERPCIGGLLSPCEGFFVICFSSCGAFSPCGGLYVTFYIYLVDHFCPYRGPFFGITNPPNENFLGHRCLPMLPYAGAHVSHLRGPMHAHTKYMYLLISIFGIYRILYGK